MVGREGFKGFGRSAAKMEQKTKNGSEGGWASLNIWVLNILLTVYYYGLGGAGKGSAQNGKPLTRGNKTRWMEEEKEKVREVGKGESSHLRSCQSKIGKKKRTPYKGKRIKWEGCAEGEIEMNFEMGRK